MVILGITGGIGSGKSYISSLLREQMNVPVYDCDTEAKRLICEDDTIRQKLTELAGASVYKNGELQKNVLADYLFASQQHVQQVNAIVHPAVRKDIGKWVKQQDSPVVAVESAIYRIISSASSGLGLQRTAILPSFIVNSIGAIFISSHLF